MYLYTRVYIFHQRPKQTDLAREHGVLGRLRPLPEDHGQVLVERRRDVFLRLQDVRLLFFSSTHFVLRRTVGHIVFIDKVCTK